MPAKSTEADGTDIRLANKLAVISSLRGDEAVPVYLVSKRHAELLSVNRVFM